MSTRNTFVAIFILALAFAGALVLGARGDGSLTELAHKPPPAAPAFVPAPGWAAVYFTQPSPDETSGGPDEALAAAIAAARLSVDIAAYDLELWSVRDALIAAHQRGVTVRVVTETDNVENREIRQIADAGIPVVDDRGNGLMHHKFTIIDRQEVWVGSMNYTLNGAYRHDNNLLRLAHPEIVEDYLVEFEEMFTDGRFGSVSRRNTPYPSITVDGVQVEVYFSPDDGVARHLLELVNAAQESIFVMAFSFTSNDLAGALITRAQAGVAVSGVFDEGQAKGTGSDYENLLAAGLDVYLDGNENKLHHKVIIIDGKIVVTGSYNFTQSAETRNDENLLIIYSPALAAKYLDEFARVYEEAKR